MKRGVIKLGLLLLVGAIINVAVAWCCATRSGGGRPSEYRRGQNVEESFRQLWSSNCHLCDRPPSSFFFARDFGIEALDLSGGQSTWVRYQAGWPMISLTGNVSRKYAAYEQLEAIDFDCAVAAPNWSAPDDDVVGFLTNGRLIPLRPVWHGFAINTVFWAAIVWLMFVAPFKVRRWRRMKRGLCAKCAYDLRGGSHEVCPECGAAGQHGSSPGRARG